MVTGIYMLGFVASAAMTGIFLSALRADFTNGYNFAALVSLLILSSFSTVIFFGLLVAQMMRALPRSLWTKLAAALSLPPVTGVVGRRANLSAQMTGTHLLPQSEFARRWMKRRSKTYEDSLCESRDKGEPRPYRLKCRQIDLIKSQPLWPRQRYSRLDKTRRY